MVHINDSTIHDEPQVPFGGMKESGYERHGGRAVIEEFTELRWIAYRGLPGSILSERARIQEEVIRIAKEIILYNLRGDVKEEAYVKRCKDYKGPLLTGLPGSKSFTLLKTMGGVQGNGQRGSPPSPMKSPFNYIGIPDATNLEDWRKSRGSGAFKEFLSQWLSKWAADFYILGGIELYHGESA